MQSNVGCRDMHTSSELPRILMALEPAQVKAGTTRSRLKLTGIRNFPNGYPVTGSPR